MKNQKQTRSQAGLKNNRKKTIKKSETSMTSKSKKNPPKREDSKKSTTSALAERPRMIANELAKLFHLPKRAVRNRNNQYIIDSITRVRETDVTFWPATNIQMALTITSIDSKLKDMTPLRSDEDTIKAFIDLQKDPIIGTRYSTLLKQTIDEYFADFDYEGVLEEVYSPTRTKFITQGSADPQLLAPIYTGVNTELVAGMALGKDIFRHDFHMDKVLNSVAAGKVMCVPKNYKSSRMITITNREIIDKQLVVSNALRDYATIKSRTDDHITQFDDQTVQHKFLKMGYATIDLSSASDRVYVKLMNIVWPQFMSTFGHLLPKDVYTPSGRIVPLTCVGTQGFPLTFTLMALICGLIIKAVKLSTLPSANYGDDCIVPEADFEETIVAFESLGLKVNLDKTHKSSNRFLESCGMDVMFTENGRREITPVYLRGTNDVQVIQFFHQLCDRNLLNPDDATGIMDRLGVKYYAFEEDYQLTEFHFPHGDIKNVPRASWDPLMKCYTCSVRDYIDEVVSIRGLSQTESKQVLELLDIEAKMKNANFTSKLTLRGIDPVARPYDLFDLQDRPTYRLYKELSSAESQVLTNIERIE
jgi:hypothetical protein